MGLFDRLKGAFRRESETWPILLKKPEAPKSETGAESLDGRFRAGVEAAQDLQNRIGDRSQEAFRPKEEAGKEPEGKSLFQKVKGLVSRWMEGINQGIEASDDLKIMDYANKLGLEDALKHKFDLANPAVQEAITNLKGYQGQAACELVFGIHIIEEVRGYKNKLEAVKFLHQLREETKAKQQALLEKENLDKKLDRELADFPVGKNSIVNMSPQHLMSLFNRAKEIGVVAFPKVTIEVGLNGDAGHGQFKVRSKQEQEEEILA